MEEAQVALIQLVKSGEDTAVILDLADETLHEMTLSVDMCIVFVRLLTV